MPPAAAGPAVAAGLQLSARAVAACQPGPPGEIAALPFAPGTPDYAAFPFRTWRACLERAWRDAGWRQLGARLARTLFVGDSAIDAEAAFAAELPFAHIQHPGHPVPVLKLKPQWQVTEFAGILAIVEDRLAIAARG